MRSRHLVDFCPSCSVSVPSFLLNVRERTIADSLDVSYKVLVPLLMPALTEHFYPAISPTPLSQREDCRSILSIAEHLHPVHIR